MRPPDAGAVIARLLRHARCLDAMRYGAERGGQPERGGKDLHPRNRSGRRIAAARVWLVIYSRRSAGDLSAVDPAVHAVGLPRSMAPGTCCWRGSSSTAGWPRTCSTTASNPDGLINPIGRFLYWNMNYHVEHHMFPMVPYHALPRLHETIKHDMPPPTPSIWAGYKEMFPIWLRQIKGEDFGAARSCRRPRSPIAKISRSACR